MCDRFEPINVAPFQPWINKRLVQSLSNIAERYEMNHTLMALAAPCDLLTLPDPDLATSAGSSASNFILMSYKRQSQLKQ